MPHAPRRVPRATVPFAVAAAFLALPPLALHSQDRAPGSAQPQMDLDAVFRSIGDGVVAAAVSERCGWGDPLRVQAARSFAQIRTVQLKQYVPTDRHAAMDAQLAQAAASVGSFPCPPAGASQPPQFQQVSAILDDAYWRMIAHVDVLAGSEWRRPISFGADERAALDREVARIREEKGYGYYAARNPLETFAQNTLSLVCREHPPADGSSCPAVDPRQEAAVPVVRALLEATAGFARAVASTRIEERRAFLAAVGDITQYFDAGGGSCTPGAMAVKHGDALVRTKKDDAGGLVTTMAFAETYTLGTPGRQGWVLLFRSASDGGDTGAALAPGDYFVLARQGGEWEEDQARAAVGDVEAMPKVKELRAQGADPALIAEAAEAYSSVYFDNFVSMGLMQSLSGTSGMTLSRCVPD